jgi:hypothetical protein
MQDVRFWETPDQLMTISVCTEGCIHVRVGRAVIKMTSDEFLALATLATRATRELSAPVSLPQAETGH